MAENRRRRLQALLAADLAERPESVVKLACERCVLELGVSGAGATVLSAAPGHGLPSRGLVCATNEVSSGLEDLQLVVGEGPCLDAFASGGPVLISDLSAEMERWPAFTPAARGLGAAAVFSFPLQIGVARVGSLDLYRDTPGPLTRAELTDALILSDLATLGVVAELDGHSTADLSWLADPHIQVHQATGMVQAQLDSTTEVALLRLRGYAFIHDVPLAEVARRVVARELRFTADEGGH
ncbi:GAF and ANTAR domain-containing protein [Actinosynnema pretiosum subsp. pretiosum]|uniref:ANTAR domain-containing protein n=2 Tax=Actinosynnema TaxID=40566 RepID=C6WQ83_ACTMD|nr:GAF and ANTAR domain-containing protein [Actinosynnema mirum]ACU36737.1 hypothetical protein Amir_2806 [Actinosynnema mirum DSM 43827]AXX30196.1 hypothetical protein APASM_2831 [Actinosynnema pretiosum subsp. pretiosum]QUF05645.1 GAF and ANTAR domain-containing protein [Actinosynnema pretiosum subsp. pretiosum]